MLVDDFRKEFDAAYLGAVVNRAMGGEADIPSWADERAKLDEMLTQEPEPVDTGTQLHLAALGLR